MLLGGFERDSLRSELVPVVKGWLKGVYDGIKENGVFAFSRKTSSVVVEFRSWESKMDYLRNYWDGAKFSHGGREIWAAPDRSPEERKRGKHLAAVKRCLIEKGVEKEKVEVEYKQGKVWVEDGMVAEWVGETLQLKPAAISAAKMGVTAKELAEAIRQRVGQ